MFFPDRICELFDFCNNTIGYDKIWPCLFCILKGKNMRKFTKNVKKITLKSFLNLYFKGFGAISPLRGCRSRFSVHFGIGDVQKAPTATRFKPILVFFAIFFGSRAFFLAIPCFPIARTHIWAPLCSSPYRIVTNLYTSNIEFYQLFFNTFVLYG